MRYANYHKHDDVSIVALKDSCTKQAQYIQRALELGHKSYFTTNHGCGGDIFEARTLCDKAGLKCMFGLEGYIVPNPDPALKDKSNYHIVIIPRTNAARKKVNLMNSRAHMEGFYMRARIFPDDLLSLSPDEVYITTACMFGLLEDERSINELFIPLMQHFGRSLFLEIQNHNSDAQKQVNLKAKEFSVKYGLRLIHGNDSHYIYPEDKAMRDTFMNFNKKKKEKEKDKEAEYILDYPDSDDIFQRYKKQGIFTPAEIEEALNNTLIFEDCEAIDIDKTVKIPLYDKTKSNEWHVEELRRHIDERFQKVVQQDHLSDDEIAKRRAAIESEFKIIADTNELRTASYFLTDEKIAELATTKYGGVLTNSGRGSCVSFYVNHVLGLTQVDRFDTDLPIFPERFMSTARILENHSLPDYDMNVKEQEPFAAASRELMGEHGCYQMVAYGTAQLGEAFRTVCRDDETLNPDDYNDIAKNIENHVDDKKWKPYVEKAQKLIDVNNSISPHPCSFLLWDRDIREEIGIVRINGAYCCLLTSAEADEWKYLKNDYLVVTVLSLICDTFNKIGVAMPPLKQLIEQCDDEVWDIYARGMTSTINQVDSDWATSLVKEYKPRNLRELAMFCGCLRPSFNSWRDKFISRQPYTTGNKYMDEVLSVTDHYIIFQENLMQYFEWLGVPPAESIGLIKKISKKKIEQRDFDDLEANLLKQWVIKTGSESQFKENWKLIQSCIAYGFNAPHAVCVSYDSLYGAYLKRYYPLQTYTVALNQYAGNLETTARLKSEMKSFGLKFVEANFDNSQTEYTCDEQTNTIYQGLPSVKFMSKGVTDYLFMISGMKPKTFMETLLLIKQYAPDGESEMCAPDSRQLGILIKLNFFSKFGNINELLRLQEIFTFLKKGEAKLVKKVSVTDVGLSMVLQNNCTSSGTQYRIEDAAKILLEYEATLKAAHIAGATMPEKIRWQKDFVGYINITGQEHDRPFVVVSKAKQLVARASKHPFGLSFVGTSIGSGIQTLYTIYEKDLKKYGAPKNDDIVYITSFPAKNSRGFRELTSFRII